ncbi:MAG: CYTH domain-containing protein [Flavobacterium sp.]|nr:CYTH domain-containing protein [Candidatus Neoflavobacterium equi]
MQEIERKFLVDNTKFVELAHKNTRIVQGYLNSDPLRTVRVRIKGSKGFLTIKGKSSENGLSRFEWEKEITVEEAEQLMPLCELGLIEKTRYEVNFEGQNFEIDIFEGQHKGLILAEIELESEDQKVTLPTWLGKEVTGDLRYYNSYLSKKATS